MKNLAVLPRARTRDLVVRELGDETLVYDLASDKAHCLNHTAALVWKSCDGKTTATGIAGNLQKRIHASIDADIVWLAIEQLHRFNLLENYEQPRLGRAVSRRNLVLKYAPAALALPVIMSITAPSPAQVVSCAQRGQPCGPPPCCPGLNCDGTCF